MKIIALEAENFAKLKVVAIRPDGAVVQVTGKNRNGKTSVLNAIWTTLAGKRVAPIEPIRHGEERARIRLTLGENTPELIVTRRFVADGEGGYTTDLRVEGEDGRLFKKGQEVLDALLGEFTFDPGAFSRMDDDAKLAALRPLVPGVDFDALTAANAEDFAARTEANRKAKDARTRASGIILPPGNVPAPVDVSALEEELAGSAQFNADIDERKRRRADAVREIEVLEEEEATLRQRLEAATERRLGLEAKLGTAEALPEPKDILALRSRLADARTANETAAKAARHAEETAAALQAEKESADLTKAMDQRDGVMSAAVAAAVKTVPGLTYEGGRVLLNGAPFSQASDAEQLETAILVAGLMNPTLRVVRVRDGSLMDEDALATLEEIAARLDLQVWVERVDSSGAVGFVLEDGEIKGPGTAPAPRISPQSAAKGRPPVVEESV